MPAEDTIWGKRFETYLERLFSIFGFEKVSEQPIFNNGKSTDYAFKFPLKWDELIRPGVIDTFENDSIVYLECKTGISGQTLTNMIISNNKIENSQIIGHILGLKDKFPNKKVIYVIATDYFKKIKYATTKDNYTFFNVDSMIDDDKKEGKDLTNISLLIFDPGRFSMYLFKKDIQLTRRYTMGLKTNNECYVRKYSFDDLKEYIKSPTIINRDKIEGITLLVGLTKGRYDSIRRIANIFADIFVDLDKSVDNSQIKEILYASLNTILIGQVPADCYDTDRFEFKINLGIHIQVPHFENIQSIRDSVIEPVQEYLNEFKEKVIEKNKSKGVTKNVRITLLPQHIRIYDYESFAPGGIISLVSHPILFFSSRSIKRKRISKRDKRNLSNIQI